MDIFLSKNSSPLCQLLQEEHSIRSWNVRFSLSFLLLSRDSGAFSLYDVDKDGFITKTEMTDIVDAIYR